MPFSYEKLSIPHVIQIIPPVFNDGRGSFMEVLKETELQHMGISASLVQMNYSRSSYGVLRGLHYQLNPAAQAKFVRCIRGEIFDVAVDIRKGSPWYGKSISQIMSEERKTILYLPCGFAHGFCVLSEIAEIEYHCTKEYAPQYERGIVWNDPKIGILWPISNPIISHKDRDFPHLAEAENNFIFSEQLVDHV